MIINTLTYNHYINQSATIQKCAMRFFTLLCRIFEYLLFLQYKMRNAFFAFSGVLKMLSSLFNFGEVRNFAEVFQVIDDKNASFIFLIPEKGRKSEISNSMLICVVSYIKTPLPACNYRTKLASIFLNTNSGTE